MHKAGVKGRRTSALLPDRIVNHYNSLPIEDIEEDGFDDRLSLSSSECSECVAGASPCDAQGLATAFMDDRLGQALEMTTSVQV
jgi:hypothetical protein